MCRRLTRCAVSAAAALALGTVPLAFAQSEQVAPRFVGTFTTDAAGGGTGFREEIDYTNPEDPDEKPYAVERILIDLHAGTRIDTSVPEQCKASSSDFMSEGEDACPPGSRIGGGEVEVDTGSTGGPLPRVIKNKLTLFNDEDTIILFTESTNTDPVIRNAGRSVAKDGQFISEAPNLPGFPPPEPYTAIRKVLLEIESVSAVRDGKRRFYLTTPGDCPAGGAWTNTARFTYRNGAEYAVKSTTPCRQKTLRVRLRGVPSGCARKSFRLRARILGGAELPRTRVFLDGKRLLTTSERRFVQRVDVTGLRPGRHRLRLLAEGRRGERARVSRSFKRCR